MTSVVRWIGGTRRRVELRRCAWARCGKPFFARLDMDVRHCSKSCACAAANAANPERLRGLRGR